MGKLNALVVAGRQSLGLGPDATIVPLLLKYSTFNIIVTAKSNRFRRIRKKVENSFGKSK